MTPKDNDMTEINNSIVTVNCDSSADSARFVNATGVTIDDAKKISAYTVINSESSYSTNADAKTATLSMRFQRPFVPTDDRTSQFTIKDGDTLTAHYMLSNQLGTAAARGAASVVNQEWVIAV